MKTRAADRSNPDGDELKLSRARLDRALDAVRMVAWEHDLLTDRSSYSASAFDVLGISPEDPLRSAADWHGQLRPESRSMAEAALAEAAAHGTPYQLTVDFLRPDNGQCVPLEIQGSVERDAQGRPLRLFGVLRDVSRRVAAERARLDSEQRFRDLADNISQLAWMADESGWIFWYNRRWFEYTGTTLEEMAGWGWRRVHHPDHVQRVVDKISACFRSGEPWEDTFPLRGRDGAYRWFLSRAVPIHDDAGRVRRWCGTKTDISDRLQAEHALQASERRYRQLADAMPHLVWTATGDGTVDYYSERARRYAGPLQRADRSWDWHPLVHPEDLAATATAWSQAVASGQLYQIEHRVRMADGGYRWHLSRAEPARDADGRVSRWFGSATDIEDQKRGEAILRAANGELEQFAYVASHDLQEPLRRVSLYTQLLLKKLSNTGDAELDRYAGFVRGGVDQAQQLVRDLLVYSRVIHHEDDPADLDASLQEALDEACEILAARITETGARIEAGPLPRVRGDVRQLSLVFQNLLSNALKYSRPGEPPVVSIRAQPRDGQYLIQVRDAGIGFAPQYAEKIFGLFKRLHRDEYPGTGLGLAICRRIIERCGGRIWAESGDDEPGACFCFTLPRC